MELAQLPCAVGDSARDCSFAVHALGFSLLPHDSGRKKVILWFLIQDRHKGSPTTNPVTISIQAHGEFSQPS